MRPKQEVKKVAAGTTQVPPPTLLDPITSKNGPEDPLPLATQVPPPTLPDPITSKNGPEDPLPLASQCAVS